MKVILINLSLLQFDKIMATGGRGSSYSSKVNRIWTWLRYPFWAIHINLYKSMIKINMHFRNLTFYKDTLTFNCYYLVNSYHVEEQTLCKCYRCQDFLKTSSGLPRIENETLEKRGQKERTEVWRILSLKISFCDWKFIKYNSVKKTKTTCSYI